MEKNMTQTNDFRNDEFQVFNQFDQQWAVVTAGTLEHFNGCTVSWGSMGNMWAKDGRSIPTITVYIHPARYTSEFLKDSDIFTVSFFPKILICTKVVEERVAVLIQGYNDRVLERGQIRKSPGVD